MSAKMGKISITLDLKAQVNVLAISQKIASRLWQLKNWVSFPQKYTNAVTFIHKQIIKQRKYAEPNSYTFANNDQNT